MTYSDAQRLTRIVTECGAALVLYARQWLDGNSAEDAVQEALLALLGQRQPPRNVQAWMYRAVRNRAIDLARGTQRRRRREQTVAAVRPEWFVPQPEALLDASAAEDSLRRLSPEHREVVVLRIWGDLPYAEIAEVLEIGVSTVHDRFQAALGQLRQDLEKPCPTNPN